MATFASLTEIKAQLRIDSDEEDSLLALYSSASIEQIESLLNIKVYDDTNTESEPEGVLFTNRMKVAQLLIIGDWYRNRENSSEKALTEIPLGAKYILLSMRKYNA